MLKITIEGPQGSGKTTAANFIAEALGNAGYLVESRSEEGGKEVLSVARRTGSFARALDYVAGLANRYLVNSKEYRLADKARIAVDELRCHLDNVVHSDCPSGTDFQEMNRLYYPGEGAPTAVTLKPEVGDGSWVLHRNGDA